MTRIAYGTDTESVEDLGQLVLLDVPDEMEGDELEEYLRETPLTPLTPVAWEEVRDTAFQAMQALGLNPAQQQYIVDRMCAAAGLEMHNA